MTNQKPCLPGCVTTRGRGGDIKSHAPGCPKAAPKPAEPDYCGCEPGTECDNHNPAPEPTSPPPVEPGSVDKNHAFQLDRKFYPITGPMTGHELMGLLGNPPDHELWKRGSGEPDRKIALDDVVDIRPGCRLYSAPRFINNSVEPGSEPPIDWAAANRYAQYHAKYARYPGVKANIARAFLAIKAERDALSEKFKTMDAVADGLGMTLAEVESKYDALAAQVKRHEEDEAANCPEDQSCTETIKALRRRLEMVHAAHIEDFVPCEQCGNCLTCDPHTHRADGTRESESSAIRARRKESEARRG